MPLIGVETVQELGVLKVGLNANGTGISDTETGCHVLTEKLQNESKNVLTGVGRVNKSS